MCPGYCPGQRRDIYRIYKKTEKKIHIYESYAKDLLSEILYVLRVQHRVPFFRQLIAAVFNNFFVNKK